MVIWVRQTVVMGVIQDVERRVLVAQRQKNQFGAGLWEFPGGCVEPAETLWQALCRELHEEVGLVVRTGQLCWNNEHAYADRTVDLWAFHITDFSGQAQGREGQVVRWVSGVVLQDLPMLAANTALLATLQQHWF